MCSHGHDRRAAGALGAVRRRLRGGVNSLALLLTLLEEGARPDHVTFADTGGEKPETYAHMRDVVAPYLERAGLPPITRVSLHKPVAGDPTLEAQCLRLGTLPSRAYGYGTCALRWKVEPQDLFLRRTYPDESPEQLYARLIERRRLLERLGYAS